MESDANTSSDPSAPPNSCSMVVNNSNVGDHHHRNGHTRATQMLPPQYPIRYNNNSHGNGFGGSMGSSPLLIRQTTSPPGFFSQFITNSQNGGGYGIESYTMVDHGASNGDSSSTSMTLKNHPRFLSGSPSLGSSMSRLTEVSEHEHSAKVGNDATSIGDNSFLTSRSFPACGSWNDSSSHFSDIFSTIKREPHNDHKLYDPSQRGITSSSLGSTTPSRQLSLPKNSSEMLSMENLLQLHDSVPCKIRAKRGCATHPRSIAERVRRTRISEKMRKLQELVPNMDKQTNTAEMLDLAVDYIKSLQKQYKALNDNHAQCNCSASQQ